MIERFGFIAILIVVAFIVACGQCEPAPVPATPTPQVIVVTATLEPTSTLPTPQPTYTPYPTYTPVPPTVALTYTPYPTATPYPTYTPYPTMTPYPTQVPDTSMSAPVSPSSSVAKQFEPTATPIPTPVPTECVEYVRDDRDVEYEVVGVGKDGKTDATTLFDGLFFRDNYKEHWERSRSEWRFALLSYRHCEGKSIDDATLTIDKQNVPELPVIYPNQRVRLAFWITPYQSSGFRQYDESYFRRHAEDGQSNYVELFSTHQNGTVWWWHDDHDRWYCLSSNDSSVQRDYCNEDERPYHIYIAWDGNPNVMVVVY